MHNRRYAVSPGKISQRAIDLKKQRLELTWIGKEIRPNLEPRILLEDAINSYHATHRLTEHDIFDNRLIFGDNLLSLKALEAEFIGKVKCVFIDPPYNTGSAFEHYDDGIEHSIWLSLMRDRLEIIGRLLAEDGSLWITIDDNEAHYLKILCDEEFGRYNFVATIVWEKRKSRENRRAFSFKHDYVFVYAKNRTQFEATRNALPLNKDVLDRYRNPDNDPRGVWQSVSALAQAGHATQSQFYTLVTPSGRKMDPPPGNAWRYTRERMDQAMKEGRIWFGLEGGNAPRVKRFLKENPDDGLTPETIWYADEVGTNDSAKRGLNQLLSDVPVFDNPKPEGLVQRILQIATNPGDLVLDSFAGSGTTGAVAQKMGRRWIMLEVGDHCHTHIIPRLRKVIDGEDPGGISEAVGWQGGGGFRYYRLAPSLLEKDKWGNWVINQKYNAAMLAEALCKLEGFSYAPSDSVYWQHGRSTERDYIYVTTASLTHEQLQQLSDDVGAERTLLALCTAFRAKTDRYSNLTVRKIPKQVLSRCEWGHDDYSLQIDNLPKALPRTGQQGLFRDEEVE
jgi:adenine-specific DNA-methyltransferase